MVGETIAGEAVNIVHAPAPLLVLAFFLTLGVGLQPSLLLCQALHYSHKLVLQISSVCREKAVFSLQAHVFQIDPETKKKWLPSSTAAVRVAYYHDPGKKTYRIIAIENNKVSTCCMTLHVLMAV